MVARGRRLGALALLAAAFAPERSVRAEGHPGFAPLPPCNVDTSDRPPQEPDCSFAPSPTAGPGAGGGSRGAVRVDAGHRNIYTAGLRYWPFARLVWGEGFEVGDSQEPLDRLLADARVRILAISGADASPTPVEIEAVVRWVASGGGLFLIFDHAPHDSAVSLLRAFLPEVASRDHTHGGQALSVGETAPSTAFLAPGRLRLDEHDAVLNGLSVLANDPEASTGDEIARVETYEGVALLPCPGFDPRDPESCAPRPPGWSPLHALDPVLVFPQGARTLNGEDISGYLQGFAFRHGAGRVYVSGEGAMFTAQRQFYFDPPPAGYGVWGMQESDNDNARFLSKIIHWLAGPDPSGGEAAGPRHADAGD